MEERLQKNPVKLLLPFGFASLVLVILLCGLAQETEAEPRVLSVTQSQAQNHHRLLDYQTGVSVCEQTPNLVRNLNPGFEQGGGDPWKPNHWYECEDCLFAYHDPGPDSLVSAEIGADSPRSEDCRLVTTPIQETPVEEGRFYDYYGRVQADLTQGDAYLRITFWSCSNVLSDCYAGEGHTTHVTHTQGAWATVTGSVQAPAGARYARVEAVLPALSVGTVHFDDVYLGLATCLEITKSDNSGSAAPGQMLTYTIVYTNVGREKATDVQIIETYDDRYVYFKGAQPPPDKGTTIWEVSELTPTASSMITVWVEVRNDKDPRDLIVNCVEIDSDELDSDEPDSDKKVHVCISTGDGCAITIYPPGVEQTGQPGEQVSYALTLHNLGIYDGRPDLVAVSSQGWKVITPSLPYTLTSGGSADMTMGLVVPPDALDGTAVVTDVTIVTATLTCVTCTEKATAVVTTVVTHGVVSPTRIAVGGPTTGFVHTAYTFIANVSPSTATLPVTYHWQATGQTPVTTSVYALSHTVRFTWSTTGTKTVTVTATNAGGAISGTHFILIEWHRVYVPLVLRRWPPAPVLYPISNPGGDGSYTVCWSTVNWGNFYVLEEDIDTTFPSPVQVYSGTNTCKSITGKGAARYYYRCKVCNGWTCSDWSNVEYVDVLWEAEPNDDGLTQANGPIVCGLTYYGTFTSTADIKDYFYFTLTVSHSVELWLTNIPAGSNYELCLRNASLGEIKCSANSGNADEHILVGSLPPGLYRIQVYKRSSTGSTQPYHLRLECR
jgi:uncharacterized repeat protein (TIGR01451 family)